ncbi:MULTISPECIES: QueT transporter family protein [unclassified Rummeliibacillus]|mgnify:CR=1 FL=1|uniref:QueT transporter family protein n=1 Tax=unclassified Rummeliibacillus TaxID=2622809 RepID=UPI000E661CAC|nr:MULTISPECIES: QueT transporter family protein [unclassified Rummeliibacillus]RIJ69652.1 QueT transporter family protein [Rummeliibacillus sp. POC4]RPJ95988.1 QueT transporter family protein [Rummeliibacillus sp. TYF005]
MKTKSLAVSAIIAALYVAVSMLIAPFGFTNVQFRISEMFNHLVVFNKKYMIGIVLGVVVTNLFSPLGTYDLVFGVGQSILALSITIFSARFIKGQLSRMIFNTIVFTITMFIIAIELNLALNLPFLFTWLTVAVGEFVVMAVGIPVISALNKRIHFGRLID